MTHYQAPTWKEEKSNILKYIPAEYPTEVKNKILQIFRCARTAQNYLANGGTSASLCYLPCDRIFQDTMEWLGNPHYSYPFDGKYGNPNYEESKKIYLEYWTPFCNENDIVPDACFGDWWC